MSVFEQYKNSRVLWVITALVLIMVIALGFLFYMAWGKPSEPPVESSSSAAASSVTPASSSRVSVPTSSRPSVSPSSQTTSPSTSSSQVSSVPINTPAYGVPTYSRPSVIDITPGAVSTLTGRSLLVSLPGLHDAVGTYDQLHVSAHGATVANKTVLGDLVITSDVKNGWVVLENILVKGNILLYGGGTVTLRDVTAAGMTAVRADAGVTNILLEGDTTVQNLTARHHITIDEDGLTPGFDGIRRITTSTGIPLWQSVTIIDGTIDAFTTQVMTNLNVLKGARVLLVTAQAQTHIEGDGTVGKLIVENDDVTYSLRPGSISTASGYYSPEQRSNSLGEPETSTPSDSGEEITRLGAPSALTITENDAEDLIFGFTHDGVGVSQFRATCYINGAVIQNTILTSNLRSWTIEDLYMTVDDTVKLTVRAESSKGTDYHSLYAEKSVTVTRLTKPTGLSMTVSGDLTFSFNPVNGASSYRLIPYLDDVALPQLTPILSGGKMTATLAAPQPGIYHFTAKALVSRLLTYDSNTEESDPITLTKISSPTGTVTPASGSIALNLTAQTGASGYRAWCNGTLLSADDSTGLTYTKLFSAAGEYIFTASALGNGSTVLDSDTVEIGRHTVTGISAATNLSLSYSGGVITATFTGSSGASGYDVTLTKNNVPVVLTYASGTTYTATAALADGDSLALSVVAQGDGISTLDSNLSSTTRIVTQLTAPTNLTFAGDGSGKAVFGFSRINGAQSYTVTYTVGGSPLTLSVAQPASGSTVSYTASFDADTVTDFKVKAIGSNFVLSSPDSSTMTVVALSVPSLTITADKSGADNNLHLSFTPQIGVTYEVLPLTLIGSTPTTGSALTAVSGVYTWSPTAVYDTGSGTVKLGFWVNATRTGNASTTYLSDSADATLQLGVDLSAPAGLAVTASGGADTLFAFNPVNGAGGYIVAYTTAGGTTDISGTFTLTGGTYQSVVTGVVPADVTGYSVTATGNDYFPDKTTTLP